MTSAIIRFLYAGLLLVLICCCSVPAEDWPWFLGPQHDGESGEQNLNLDWTKIAPSVMWKQSVGTGYSAPSVVAGKLVVHHRLEGQEVISCRSTQDGSELWQYAYPSTFEDPYGYNNGPR